MTGDSDLKEGVQAMSTVLDRTAQTWLWLSWGIGLAATAIAQLLAAHAIAQDLPAWKIADICRADSATTYCSVYEKQARSGVSGNWTLLPKPWRETCLKTFAPPLEPSWRLLGACLEERMATARQDYVRQNEAAAERKLAALAEAKRKAEEAARLAAEAEARRKAEEAARLTAEAEAKRKAEEVARPTAEAEAKRKAEEAARLAAEAEQERKAEEAAKLAAEAEAKRKAEEAARLAAEAEAKRKAEEAARLAAEAEAKRKAEEAAKLAATAEAQACVNKVRAAAKKGTIRFKLNQGALDKRSKPTLDRLVATVKACPKVRFSIEGHTDSVGNAGYNMRLSSSRAKSVADYLIGAGIAAERIKAVGYGETRPIAPNNSRKNRAKNRRIEFSLQEN